MPKISQVLTPLYKKTQYLHIFLQLTNKYVMLSYNALRNKRTGVTTQVEVESIEPIDPFRWVL